MSAIPPVTPARCDRGWSARMRLTSWRCVLAAYILAFGILLLATKGYPYVFDNNESYSCWWHARSLWENGVAQTKGLTDEVFAHHPEASPYIHSHQGNFPRLFTFLLYALGLRSIEAQIWITTFTVGLAAVWLAFLFLSRLGNPLYAALTCLVLMTDYLFFAQWQVNLYNVWHGFFFFSSLLCVQSLGNATHRGRWTALTLLNFAALFYWEYVFTCFTALLCGLYAAVLYRRQPRLMWMAWGCIATGATFAAGVLLAQLTAYMGWVNVMEDVRLTLTARNAAADPALLERVTSFYREHRIIFWHNFFEASPLRTFRALLDSLSQWHLKYYGPDLVYTALVLFAGWLLAGGRCLGGLTGRWKFSEKPVSEIAAVQATSLAKFLLTAACVTGLAKALSAKEHILASVALTPILGFLWTGQLWGWYRLSWLRFLPMFLLVAVSSWLAGWTASLLDPALKEQWLATPGGAFGLSAANFARYVFTGAALTLVATGGATILGWRYASRLAGLLPLLLCAIPAYAITYLLFTGYVYSGYLHRFVPLTVFVTAPLLGLALYIAIRIAQSILSSIRARIAGILSAWQGMRQSSGRSREKAGIRLIARLLTVFAIVVISATLGGLNLLHWVLLQTTYLRVAPADNYSFLALLEKSPYRGRSIVSNTYPAPMAARTKSWGYADTAIFSGMVTLTPQGFETDRDLKYLWFADRDSNPAYLKPDLAVTVIQPTNFPEALQRYQERQFPQPSERPLAENTGLFRRAQSHFQPFLRHKVAATDGRHFSIVRLDWDYPPYLRPHPEQMQKLAGQLTLSQKLALSENAREMTRRWRVELEFLDVPPSVRAGLFVLTCDGQPVIFQNEPADTPLTAIVYGNQLSLRLRHSPTGGQVRVTVNDTSETFDLSTLPAEPNYEWSAEKPHGSYTRIPSFTQGLHVQTRLLKTAGEPVAELSYRYAHQDGNPEAGTVVRLYREDSAGRWHLADAITFLGTTGIPVRLAEFRRENPDTVAEYLRCAARNDPRTYEQWLTDHLTANPDEWNRLGIVREALPTPPTNPLNGSSLVTRRLPLPVGTNSRLQFSVAPSTRSKTGPEYFGLPFTSLSQAPAAANPAIALPSAASTRLPFGQLKLRLRFPTNRWPQSEPIVSTGSTEVGDFIYVIYTDPAHIRIGFDHWFKGGPLSEPIALDFDREHELEISMGSLFPSADDIVFLDTPPAVVAEVKNRVVVKLDGRTIIDTDGVCYESSPSQVTIGRNEINGTSCGSKFTGEILSIERVWPDIK